MANSILPGDRVILYLSALERHGIVVKVGLPGDQVEIELTDAYEAGRKVLVPQTMLHTPGG
jgi:translation initiation factor IF-1